jgi:membrane-associated phospholipid phosphatase
MTTRTFLIVTVVSALALAACITWIDYPLAAFLGHQHRHVTKTVIPNLLLPGCLLLVGAAWGVYRFNRVTGRWRPIAAPARAIGITVPVIYIVKEFAQHFFGRLFPRAFLMHPDFLGFRFFHTNYFRGGFPSGHMMITVCLLLTLSRVYRLPRLVWIGLGIALGAALVATNYHFLGDVVAGAYGGFVVEGCMRAWASGPESKSAPGEQEAVEEKNRCAVRVLTGKT